MIYAEYLILAAIVIFCSIKVAYYVDLIDKKTNLSGAFIGGAILAAITSLPELFTSMSAIVLINQPELVTGNILGSNIFNNTILSALILVTYKKYNKATVSKSHDTTLICIIVIYLFLILEMIFNVKAGIFGISYTSFIIVLLYIFGLRQMSKDDCGSDDSEPDTADSLTLKQVVARFILYSICLVIASIFITYVTDDIANELNLGRTIAGALFLGVATSLPEVSSCISLVKLGNYNAMVGNIVGSSLFNFIIIALADVVYRQGSLYTSNNQTTALIYFGTISVVSLLVTGVVKRKNTKSERIKSAAYIVLSLVGLCSYIGFLAFSLIK